VKNPQVRDHGTNAVVRKSWSFAVGDGKNYLRKDGPNEITIETEGNTYLMFPDCDAPFRGVGRHHGSVSVRAAAAEPNLAGRPSKRV